jgi:hypothetical protein
MVQVALPLKNQSRQASAATEEAQVVGLTCEQDTVTLQFLDDGSAWGQRVRQIRLDRSVAEELSRLLNYELEDEFKF